MSLNGREPFQRLNASYSGAREITLKHGITPEDVLQCSEKFWNMHLDSVSVRDFSAWGILAVQLNLCTGVIGYYAAQTQSEYLTSLAKQIVSFEISAQFMLTEVGHGLDALNLETTATLLQDGSFDLHTPHGGAEKFMPPTLPDVGVPKIGIVMARLIDLDGKNKGVRAFIVPLNDGEFMCTGVIARVVPDRTGTPPFGQALTRFNHVLLPNHALLGPLNSTVHPRVQFLSEIWRVGIGSATLIAGSISVVQTAAYIVATYSKRRAVGIPPNQVPIFTFRTQQRPILHALARSFVLEALFKNIRTLGGFDRAFENRDDLEHVQIRNAYSTIFKVLTANLCRESIADLGERCGAQGLFGFNQLLPGEMSFRGIVIAEGDPLVLSIRLAFELLLGRYTLETPRNPKHFLATHEASILSELQSELISASSGTSDHRGEKSNAMILPRANSLVEGIGARMAYDAASLDPEIHPAVLKLFAISCVQRDPSWYVESGTFSRAKISEEENQAIEEMLPILDELLSRTGVEPYVYAKICKPDWWIEFAESLPVIGERPVENAESSQVML
ncbi:acyl-CoA oxidase [Marasmius fiardii PR-910]|nr:acyl-CoA oxidase [Marasmius fiardii PR-910]